MSDSNEDIDSSRSQSKEVGAAETSSAKRELSQDTKDTHRVPDSHHLTNAGSSEVSPTKWQFENSWTENASSTNSLWKPNDSLPSNSITKLTSNLPARHTPFSCGWFVQVLWRLRGVFSPRLALQELRSPLFWHDVIAETVLCMYYECLIIFISVTFNSDIYRPSITHFGLYAGFFVFVCIEGWAPMCGASVNPARTWSVFLAGRMTFIKALIYTIVEIGGAAAGTMIGYGLTPSNATGQIIPLLPGAGVTAVQGMAIEAVLTFNLIFVGLVLGQPSGQPSAIASLTVGFCVGTGVLAAGTHTGGLQNPIVAFGPAIISGNFQDHWLYWVGPYVGSTVATAFYLSLKLVRETYEQKNQSGDAVNGDRQETSTAL